MDVEVGVVDGFMEDKRSRRKDWLNRDMVESEVENLVSRFLGVLHYVMVLPTGSVDGSHNLSR